MFICLSAKYWDSSPSICTEFIVLCSLTGCGLKIMLLIFYFFCFTDIKTWMTVIKWIYNISLNEKTPLWSPVDKLILYKIKTTYRRMLVSVWCTNGGFHAFIQLSENHSPSPEQSNQKRCVWTRGDWPLLLGFVFAEQFLQASVLEALRMGCRSSYCDHIIEGICGGNMRKHPSTGLTNHKQAHGTQFASIFCLVLCASYCFVNIARTACSTFSFLRLWQLTIHLLKRIQCGTTCCLDACKHTQRASSMKNTCATDLIMNISSDNVEKTEKPWTRQQYMLQLQKTLHLIATFPVIIQYLQNLYRTNSKQ